jgi:hypothetical protein
MEDVAARLAAPFPDPGADEPFKATTEGRLGALSDRLIDPDAPDFPRSKINMAVDNIFREYEAASPCFGTRIVFRDLSPPAPAPPAGIPSTARSGTSSLPAGRRNGRSPSPASARQTPKGIGESRYRSDRPDHDFSKGERVSSAGLTRRLDKLIDDKIPRDHRTGLSARAKEAEGAEGVREALKASFDGADELAGLWVELEKVERTLAGPPAPAIPPPEKPEIPETPDDGDPGSGDGEPPPSSGPSRWRREGDAPGRGPETGTRSRPAVLIRHAAYVIKDPGRASAPWPRGSGRDARQGKAMPYAGKKNAPTAPVSESLIYEGRDREYWASYRGGDVPAAHLAARHWQLPADFPFWDIALPGGWTAAHEGARYGSLPDGFDRWELATDAGSTVAHVAADYGNLPEDFDRWELRNGSGWTVAMCAGLNGTLPEGFDRWDLAGETARRAVRNMAGPPRRRLHRFIF